MQNSRKAHIGRLAGLHDPALMQRKKADEKKLRDAVAGDEKLKYAADAWDRIAKAEKTRSELLHRYVMLEGGSGFKSQLFAYRPHPGAGRRGAAQEEWRPAARVPRQRSGRAEVPPVLRRADL